MGKDEVKRKSLDTTKGWVKYGRYRYLCSKCKKYYYPVDTDLELSETSRMSPKKEDQISKLSVRMPYEEVEKTYKELTGLPASRSAAHRVVQEFGKKVKEKGSEVKYKEVKGEGKEHVGADGVMVHIRAEGWKEMKIGAYYKLDGTEEREMKDVRYVATSESRETIGQQLYELAGRPNLEKSKEIGFISDGAQWLEDMRKEQFPKSVGILDFYHAAGYIGDVGKSFYEEQEAEEWIKKKCKQLKKGKVRQLERNFEKLIPETGDQREVLSEVQRYFKNHKHKMKYNVYRSMGYHIGSGIIEAACKHVVQNRFKRTGMRWSRRGCANLLALRVAYLNDDWDFVQEAQWN